MATLRLKYVHSFVDKTGRTRFYFRYRGKRWPLPGEPGTAEFGERYDALRRECLVTKAHSNNVVFGPGTVGQVIEKYLASAQFSKRAHNTRRAYRPLLDRLKEIGGQGRIVDLRERHVRQIRKQFNSASAADGAVMLIRMLWVFAKESLDMELGPNPAAEIKNLHKQSWSHEPWPDWVVAKFEAEARPKPNAQFALLLLLYTGQRVGDVAAMKWSQFDGDGIQVRQQKTGNLLWIPCHSRLKAALEGMERRSEFILTTQQKRGYSAGSLGNMIQEASARLGAKDYTAHGLRCNAAVTLIEAGCEVPQVMAILGHKTWKEAMRYAAQRDQKKLARQAMDQWEKVANLRTKDKRASG
jgi:integrase